MPCMPVVCTVGVVVWLAIHNLRPFPVNHMCFSPIACSTIYCWLTSITDTRALLSLAIGPVSGRFAQIYMSCHMFHMEFGRQLLFLSKVECDPLIALRTAWVSREDEMDKHPLFVFCQVVDIWQDYCSLGYALWWRWGGGGTGLRCWFIKVMGSHWSQGLCRHASFSASLSCWKVHTLLTRQDLQY